MFYHWKTRFNMTYTACYPLLLSTVCTILSFALFRRLNEQGTAQSVRRCSLVSFARKRRARRKLSLSIRRQRRQVDAMRPKTVARSLIQHSWLQQAAQINTTINIFTIRLLQPLHRHRRLAPQQQMRVLPVRVRHLQKLGSRLPLNFRQSTGRIPIMWTSIREAHRPRLTANNRPQAAW